MKFAIVDIETTGSNASHDRITEIAVYIHDGQKITDEFCTLINPEFSIAPFVTRLTGINNEMVENAPKFFEVAKKIVQLTDGAVFVAHNVSFDYGIIRREFKSLGFNYTRDYLCTIKLSRKLFPGFNSYSLGNLCENLNIKIESRHRAGGDALATVKLFEMLIGKNKDNSDFTEFIRNDYVNLRFPPGINSSEIDNLPDSCGVYYLHDNSGKIIYIGKSNNIRSRILSHFANKQSRKALELRNSICHITYEETGNELIALLLESDEIKKIQPFFNRALKRTTFNHSIYLEKNENGYLTFRIKKEKESDDTVITTVGTHDQAIQVIDSLVGKFNLCQKICGIYNIVHACFGYSVKQCYGACIGKEKPEDYNKRVSKAVASLQFKNPDFMIINNGRSSTEKSVVSIEKGRYVGFGYFDSEFFDGDVEQLKDFITYKEDNRDVNRIINQYLRQNSEQNIVIC